MKKYPRILFFINGTLPSIEAQEIAESLGPNVAFRNANFVPDSGCAEKCDGVAGAVPKLYSKFPSAKEAINSFNESRAQAMEAAKEGQYKRAEQQKIDEELAMANAEKQKIADMEAANKKATAAMQVEQNEQSKTNAAWTPNAPA